VPIWLYHALFKSNFPFWLLQKVAPQSLDVMFDVTPALRAGLSAEEEATVSNITGAFQPVTVRINGLRNEGAAIDPQASYHLEVISTPTLIVHTEDDHINPFTVGEHTATHIPDAQFLPYTTGGHLLLGHQAEIRAKANTFLHQYASSAK
jgi:pimeloyl-ACP methyl ester carboxylesterase